MAVRLLILTLTVSSMQLGLSDNRPNIVVIVCDSMDGRLTSGGRYDGVVDMPNLRTMSKRGTTYLNAYTNSPICVPSRSALWGGMYTHITESWNNFKGLPEGFNDTWEDRLSESGYATKILGKVDYRSGGHSLSNRVEAWTRKVNFTLRQEGRPTVKLVGDETTQKVNTKDWKVAEEAVRYINSREDGPFLLYVGLNLPHPYPTPSEGENYGGSTFKTSSYWLKKVDVAKINLAPWLPQKQMHPVDVYSTIVKNCSSKFSEKELIAIKTYFYAMCAEVDGIVGEIITALDQTRLSESTYVVFTSDHGELAMEHRQFYKMSMYEGSAHVPLIVSHPRQSAHRSRSFERNDGEEAYYDSIGNYVDGLASLVDIYPTLLEIAGLPTPGHLNGSSLFGPRPRSVLSQFHGCNVNASTYMLRFGPWKYIAFDYGPGSVQSLLFNLQDDPDELANIANLDPHLVFDLDNVLKNAVDYPVVTQKVEKYNQQSFIRWRFSEGPAYEETIANLRWWMDWQNARKENQDAIDRWLNAGL